MRTHYLHSLLRVSAGGFLLGFVAIVVSGCRLGNPGTPGTLGLPPENQARIVSRQIATTGDKRHWKWSLIGERTWMVAKNTGGILSLENTLPLNDPTMKGGTNIWEVDLTVEKSPSGIQWETRLHGSNGMTAAEGGTATGDLGSIQRTLDHDSVVGLPAEVILAHVGNQAITWHLAR